MTVASAHGGLSRGEVMRQGILSVAGWPLRRWLAALGSTLLAALVMGVPTGIVQTSFYTRMTPVTWWNYPVWAASALLIGLIAATYVRAGTPRLEAPDRSRRTIGATLLTTFAVGCPICNKLVVGLIGVSGALNYWAPLQPILGLFSVGLLVTGLTVRLRGAVLCEVRPATT